MSISTFKIRYGKQKSSLQWVCAMVVALMSFAVALPTNLLAQQAEQIAVCYGVTDGFGNGSGADSLVSINVFDGQTETIGGTETLNIEAIAFSPDGKILYAADAERFGTINLSTGLFTEIGDFGSGDGGEGSDGVVEMNDVDGLTYDVTTDTLFGTNRRAQAPADLLFKIDTATGAIIEDGFGDGVDYVAIPLTTAGDDDADDIAADPFTGILYGALNNGNTGGTLVEINKVTGAITEIGPLTSDDIEGLGFVSNGTSATLYGSTGNNGGNIEANNKLFRIDKTSGVATLVNPLPENETLRDYESLDCKLPAGLGDYVWDDTNQDGIQDTTEPIVEGVIVNLWTDDDGDGLPDTQIDQTTTNADGLYEFLDLAPNVDYIVEFIAPDGYTFTPQGAGEDDAADSNVDPTSGLTSVINIAPGEFDPTIDAGIILIPQSQGSIGDQVFCADTGAGIAGIEVDLSAAFFGVQIAVTDANGNYLFSDLPAGEYTISVSTSTLPDSCNVLSIAPDGGDDSTVIVTLAEGENNLVQDFTYMADVQPVLASLGDYVWEDTNENGLQDTDEPPLAGVTVNLWTDDDNDGNPDTTIDSTETDLNGAYSFTDLDPALDYIVQFLIPVGREFTTQDSGNDAADSDPDPANGITEVVQLNSGENNTTIDAGVRPLLAPTPMPTAVPTTMPTAVPTIVPTVEPTITPTPDGPATLSLGDQVWLDTNNNGILDIGEAGVENVELVLWTDDDGDGFPNTQTSMTATTAADGTYLFSGLEAGNYVIQIPLTNFGPGAALEGLETSTGNSAPTDPDDNVNNDDDGISVNAVGVINTSITLFQNDEPINDGDTDPNTNLTVDFGFFDPNIPTPTPTVVAPTFAELGNLVFLDNNQDGIQTLGEAGIPGVAVVLEQQDEDGLFQTADQTVTDESGEYLFSNLETGQYRVRFTLPIGYNSSPANQGADDEANSDGVLNSDGTEAITTLIQLNPGDSNKAIDQGFYQAAELGDRVFIDNDQDGIQDAGEVGLPGVVVELYTVNSNGSTTPAGQDTTDSNGIYLFENLIPGDYQVNFQVPAGYIVSPVDAGTDNAADSDGVPNVDGSQALTSQTALEANESDTTWDLGVYLSNPDLVDIGDFVFRDTNANGIQDPGEFGIAGATVILERINDDNSIMPIAQTQTGPSGEYLFSGLEPGDYQLTFVTPDGYAASPTDQGGDDANDSDGVPSNNGSQSITSIITLEPGEMDRMVDQGYYVLSTIGSRVWYDENQDGIQNIGESGVPGVTVILEKQDPNNGSISEVARTATDADGNYLFANQQPGVYTVIFLVPSGYVVSPLNSGNDTTIDSDGVVSGLGASTPAIELAPGETDLTYDLGLFLTAGAVPASVGDKVWYDTNQDGIQDANEPGIQGFLVHLYDNANNKIAETITNEAGEYLFGNLVTGTYSVRFISQPGYISSPLNVGDDATDSDTEPSTGFAPPVTLVAGQTVLDIDSGFYAAVQPPSSISNIIWYDENANGIQDEVMARAGIPGVLVRLFTGDGVLLQSRLTDTNGEYEFVNIPPGEYYLEVELPDGYKFSPQNADLNDTIDSDVNPETGQTEITTLDPGENDPSWDGGAFIGVGGEAQVPSGIGSRVWDDENMDGVQDQGESGVPGVMVHLYTSTGMLVADTTTDATGGFLFANIQPGEYYLEFETPNSFMLSSPNQSGDPATDSNPDPATGRTEITLLEPGEVDLQFDAGIFQTPGGLDDPTGQEPGVYSNFMYLPLMQRP